MDIDLPDTQQRIATQLRAESDLAIHERLAIAALVAAVTLWLRVVEVIPDLYPREPCLRSESSGTGARGRVELTAATAQPRGTPKGPTRHNNKRSEPH